MRQIWTRHRGISPRDQAFDELAKAAGGGTRLSRRQVFRAAAIVAGVGAAGQIIEIPRATAASPGSCTPGNYEQCRTAAAAAADDTYKTCLAACGALGIRNAHCRIECAGSRITAYYGYLSSCEGDLSCPGAGETCVAGFCRCGRGPSCGRSDTCCDGECVDLAHDDANCGTCANNCAVSGLTCCNSTCTSTGDDSKNCGDCGIVCPAGAPTCCGGTCLDTSNDPANCGDCDIVCPSGSCVNGTCTDCEGAGCPAGYSCCTANNVSTCFNLDFDSNNCGSCGHACAAGETCVNGACTCGGVSCAAGETCVNGTCTCGGVPCDAAGQVCCGGTCVNTQTDLNNCGGCGNTCPIGATCDAGSCSGCGTTGGPCGPGEFCCFAGGVSACCADGAYCVYCQGVAGCVDPVTSLCGMNCACCDNTVLYDPSTEQCCPGTNYHVCSLQGKCCPDICSLSTPPAC
jgi:hypothetical protein